MVIKTNTYKNFLTYLKSMPESSILVSSIQHNLEPNMSFGLPSEKTHSGYHFVLYYQGISVEYCFEPTEKQPLPDVTKIWEISQDRGILIIPIEEGDYVTV